MFGLRLISLWTDSNLNKLEGKILFSQGWLFEFVNCTRKSVCLVEDGINMLRKAHMWSTQSIRSFLSIAFSLKPF